MEFSKLTLCRSGFARGSRWLLTFWLCLSLFVPGQLAAANAGVKAPKAAPVIDTQIDLNLPLSTTAAITDALLHANDSVLPNALVYTVVTNVTQGTLKLNDSPLAQGGTFTQQDINDGLVTYSAPGTVGTTTFTFHVSNGTETTVDQVYTIHINKAEPTVYPTNFQAVAQSTSRIVTTWTDVPGANAPDGYLVLCAPDSAPNLPTDTTTPIDNICTDGSGSIHVPQGTGTLTWDGLSSETTYHFAIYPFAQTLYNPGPGSFNDYLTAPGAPAQNATTLKTYSISGTITDAMATPIMGALVSATYETVTNEKITITALTGEDGSYTVTGLIPEEYTVSVSLVCATFAPVSIPVTVDDFTNHVSGVNFTATILACIHGVTMLGTTPLAGVVISDGAGHSLTTGEDGSFRFGVPSGWSGTLAPSKTNFAFLPSQRSYTNVTTDQYFQGFSGIKLSVQSKRFTAVWAGVAGATSYLLDVAFDVGFTSFVPGYQDKDVGNVTQVSVTGLAPHTRYYYRVRAYDALRIDTATAPVEVLTNLIYYFPVIGR